MTHKMEQAGDESKSGLSPKAIVGLILGVLALIFVFQNADSGEVNVLFWDLKAPAWLWLLALFAIGFVVGSLNPWFRKNKRKD
jgi:uncharacterized integral membrane protein